MFAVEAGSETNLKPYRPAKSPRRPRTAFLSNEKEGTTQAADQLGGSLAQEREVLLEPPVLLLQLVRLLRFDQQLNLRRTRRRTHPGRCPRGGGCRRGRHFRLRLCLWRPVDD